MDKIVQKISTGLKGTITIPSDKSISHRAVMLSSIANGKSLIKNFSLGKDPISTLNIFKSLGINAEFLDSKTLEITSNGKLTTPQQNLDCGNSGTTMRLSTGILSAQPFNSVLFGDESLSKRPMKRIIEPLKLMGAEINSDNFKAPLYIKGSKLSGINYNLPISSAQVKSCILLAGLFADGKTTIHEPNQSRNHTELMLKYLRADISSDFNTIELYPSKLEAKNIEICGDISSAAYFITAALIVPNSDIIIKNVGLNPTRAGIIKVAKQMGANIEILNQEEISGELVGDIRVKYSELKGTEISGEIIPTLIDEIPVIAVLATQANGITTIKDAADLRNKESDRISAIVIELKKLGADIQETQDGFIVNGKRKLQGDAEINTYHDHRIAMSLYVAGLISEKPLNIKEFEWVDISFPEFEELFQKLYC